MQIFMISKELQRKQVKEALRIIIDKFDNDLYSLCSVIHFLGCPQTTVNDLRIFLSTMGGDGIVKQSQAKFYKKQLNQLQQLTQKEEHILEILAEYVVRRNCRIKAVLQELLDE